MSGGQMLRSEKPRRALTQTGNGPSSCGAPGGFTLIELLVVISIVTLLTAILLPTLQRARRQAKAIACQANLRQWGVVFCMYMNEHDDRLSERETVLWWRCARRHYAECNDLLLCPMATRYTLNTNAPLWEVNLTAGHGTGSKFSPWKFTEDIPPGARRMTLYGSYAVNAFAITSYALDRSDIKKAPLPARSRMPFLMDCVDPIGNGHAESEPPAFDGDLGGFYREMKSLCIDRHNGAINSLFHDWSVRKVGLKELWTLKWSGPYNTCGPWTRAGGVQPEDWPVWMRRFKDY
jgi:prepilin-type N-terminal cleavage/methylation domain-containing protein/prepilin-type processing-associated H-X9-DG protein